jgi:prevent-host-death family protein
MKTQNIISLTEARSKIFKIVNLVQKTGVYFTLTLNGKAKAVLLSSKYFDSLVNKVSDYQYQKSPFVFSNFLLGESLNTYGYRRNFDKKLLEDFIFGQVIKIISDEFKEPVSARNAFFSSDFSIKISDYLKSLNIELNIEKINKDKKLLEQIKNHIQNILETYDFDKIIFSKTQLDILLKNILDFMARVV